MKKYFLIIIAVFAFGCSDDDDNNIDNGIANPYTGSVIGTWVTNAVTIDGNSVNLGCNSDTDFEDNYTFVFYDNNNFDVYHNCYIDQGIYNSGTYTTTGNVLTLNMNGQTGKAHMVKSPNDMFLEFRFTIGSDGLFYNHSIFVKKQ